MSSKLSRKRLKSYEKKTLSDLPFDLESEILSRVPANSLAKLKTTCKRWYSLFKDPKFVETNVEKARAKELIFLMSFGVYSISVDLHDPSMDITGKLKCLQDSKDLEIFQIYHYNGLIVCWTRDETEVVVWNPYTGETISVKPRNSDKYDAYAFGYGNTCKILGYSSYYNNYESVFEIGIYDISSNSWRVLDGLTQRIYICTSGLSLKGNTYWIARDEEEDIYTLLRFDFTTESFESFPLPYLNGCRGDELALSVVKDEKIAMLHYDIDKSLSKISIWLTNKIDYEGKQVSWSKFLEVDFDKFGLLSYSSVITFLVDVENKVAICCSTEKDDERSYVYIVGEDFHKEIYRQTTKGFWYGVPCLLSYVPSLVRIQGNTTQNGGGQ